MHMRRTLAPVVVVTICSVLAPAFAQEPQPERPTFSASVSLVPITAVVRDSKSRLVRGLKRDDFQVFENSQPRRILEFKAMTDGPISIGLLFDTSGSMRGTALDKGRAVVDQLLSHVKPAGDEVALFTFDKKLRQDTPFNAGAASIRGALDLSRSWGTTSLYDAIAEAARRVSERATSRRALVVVTDGLDTSSTMTPADVSALASATDVPVYVLPVEVVRRVDATGQTGDLSDLAYWTGGELMPVAELEQMPRAVATLVAELRQQYFLAIESSTAAGWYRLDVATRRRDLSVRTRSGYFAATDPPRTP
jgi:Ca-activated chloride channel family protein